MRSIWLVLTVLGSCLALAGGCVSAERFVPRVVVQHPAAPEVIAEYLEAHPELDAKRAAAIRNNELLVGMPVEQVMLVGGDSLDRRDSPRVWRLRRQFRRFWPGFYPYFDSRELYLYIHNDVLAAMIVRGSHNVYP